MSAPDAHLRTEAEAAHALLESQLLAEATPEGAWEGELSSSALATAVAITALVMVDRETHAGAILAGARWLRAHANADGGWGDSPTSRSNLSTTTLAWSALSVAGEPEASGACHRAEQWVKTEMEHGAAPSLAEALARRYGNDRTFSAPILTVAALTGTLGPAPDCWRQVPQLPFELAVLPRALFAWLRLPVVSYALPALIAIGLARHHYLPSRRRVLRALRDRVTERALAKLERLQPENGGFLEATPLTAFVTMSLAACGRRRSVVVERGVRFLLAGQRSDGSWPIDSNLATWLTTLAVKALAAGGRPLAGRRRQGTLRWLLGQQHVRRDPFTRAQPGGFSWTPLPGGVPDADDTAGALLALHHLDPAPAAPRASVRRAAEWLLALQNVDGGVPTFCRGFGRLPFDRSCPDVTAHALRALSVWAPAFSGRLGRRARRFACRARQYLAWSQRHDGSWLPLLFGNQWQPGDASPVYGTAQVVLALQQTAADDPELTARLARGVDWLRRAQNSDGGWGGDAQGGSTVEETGLALAALAGCASADVLAPAVGFIVRRTQAGRLAPAPIGLYFSSLWYSERLYPLVFALLGLGRFLALSSAVAREQRGPAAARVA